MSEDMNRANNLIDLTSKGAVCVVMRSQDRVTTMVYDRDNRSTLGTQIRTYLPGAVDGRWDGPILTTAVEVFSHLARTEEPCVVPVSLAQSLFNWQIPFASLPDGE